MKIRSKTGLSQRPKRKRHASLGDKKLVSQVLGKFEVNGVI